MKLTEVIKIWDAIHNRDTGDLGFSDLEKAIEKTVGVQNDIIQPARPPGKPRGANVKQKKS